MEPLYTLRNVRRCYGDREVLNIPDLTLDAGKVYGLLGPNGSGKTTLMRLLAFLDVPTAGTVSFRGQEVPPERYRSYRSRVVWVPQSPVLFTGSLLYNVEYPMRLKGVPKAERRARALELLDDFGLGHLANAGAKNLSGGEAQRGSIARALAAGAEVILFDEPTANVDYKSRGEIIRHILDLWQNRGISVIVTTHDFDLAAEVCGEEIILFDGRVVSRYPLAGGGGGGLPRSATAWTGVLERPEGGVPRLRVVCDEDDAGVAEAEPPPFTGRDMALVALSESSSGVVLRLRMAHGHDYDVVVKDGASVALARTMTLGETLSVHCAGTTRVTR